MRTLLIFFGVFLFSSCSDERFRLGRFLSACSYDLKCVEWYKDYSKISKELDEWSKNKTSKEFSKKLANLYSRQRIPEAHPDFITAIEKYIEVLGHYSFLKPNEKLRKDFELNYFFASTCLNDLGLALGVNEDVMWNIYPELNALIFKRQIQWDNFFNGFYRKTDRTPLNLTRFEMGVFFESYCGFKVKSNKRLYSYYFSLNGKMHKGNVKRKILDFEKKHGVEHREKYRDFIEK